MDDDVASEPAPAPDGGPARDTAGLAREVELLLRIRLGPHLHYHGPAHTLDDVAPAAAQLAASEGVPRHRRALIRAAALLHDAGHILGPKEHERASVGIAEALLPRHGFSDEEVASIGALIMATRPGSVPRSLDERILVDADLDVLGRRDFWSKNLALRRELAGTGVRYDDAAWLRAQLRFLRRHRYHTATARRERGAGKLANARRLEALLETVAGRRGRRGG